MSSYFERNIQPETLPNKFEEMLVTHAEPTNCLADKTFPARSNPTSAYPNLSLVEIQIPKIKRGSNINKVGICKGKSNEGTESDGDAAEGY